MSRAPLLCAVIYRATVAQHKPHRGQELERLHARIASRFARPEPRRRALAYLQGILSATQRRNGWQLAEHAGEARPDGMHTLQLLR